MVPAMSEKKFKVHGCGLTARSIKATTPEEAAKKFQFDVNAEKYRGAFVQEGEIVINDGHGKLQRFSWDLKPIEAPAK
jgi:hypothetical protein